MIAKNSRDINSSNGSTDASNNGKSNGVPITDSKERVFIASEDVIQATLDLYAKKPLLSYEKQMQLCKEAYDLRRQGRLFLLLLPIASEMANSWIQKTAKNIDTDKATPKVKKIPAKKLSTKKRAQIQYKPISPHLDFYKFEDRKKIKLLDLKKRLWISTQQVAYKRKGFDIKSAPKDSGPLSLISTHIERLEHAFSRYRGKGKAISENAFVSLLEEGQLALDVSDPHIGTGSVYLSDLNFEKLLEIAIAWDKRIKHIESKIDEIAINSSIPKAELYSASKIYNSLSNTNRTEILCINQEIRDLEKEAKVPFSILKNIISQIAKIEKARLIPENTLWERNMRFVINIATQEVKEPHKNPEVFTDIVQEGGLGLKKGIARFDSGLQNKPTTFWKWWIYNYITSKRDNQTSIISVPRYIVENARKLWREMSNSSERSSIEAFENFLIDKGLNVWQREKIVSGLKALKPIPLEAPSGESNENPFLLEDKNTPNLINILAHRELLPIMHEALSDPKVLSNVNRKILIYRYGLNGGDPKTIVEIADRLKLTRETVRKRIVRSRDKLKRHLESQYGMLFST